MQIGLIADTHDNVEATRRAVELFEEAGVEIVVHCGDFVAPPVISLFEGFELHGVLGNNDGEVSGLEAAFADLGTESELHGRFADLEFDGLSLAALHGESLAEVRAIAESEAYDYVCYGHHHRREREQIGRTTLVNPGGQFPTIEDDHRTVGVLDTRSETVRFRSVLE